VFLLFFFSVETVEELLRGVEGEHKANKARVESDLAEIDETVSGAGVGRVGSSE
jgi:hypothetical protein